MQLKEKNVNKMIEHKKRLEKHRKTIENDTKDVETKEKTTKDEGVRKKKVTTKRKIDNKAIKEKQKAIAKKALEKIHEGHIDDKENLLSGESKVIITKEERAERFKRLNAMVKNMMKKNEGLDMLHKHIDK